jgi:hypothetical protein
MNPEEAQRIIAEILLREWDPIGVSEYPEAADEYDSYVPHVYELLIHGATAKKVFEYLWSVETHHIGVLGNPTRTEKVAERLARLMVEPSS